MKITKYVDDTITYSMLDKYFLMQKQHMTHNITSKTLCTAMLLKHNTYAKTKRKNKIEKTNRNKNKIKTTNEKNKFEKQNRKKQ